MVAVMEVSEKDIETLREAIDGCGGSSYTQALAILDRLSPPAPEVDEATLVWREMTAQAYEAVNNSRMAEGWRTGEMDASKWQAGQLHHLREVLAAKDAERDHREKAWLGWQERCLKAESELAALRAEIERLKADNMPPEGYKNLYIAARDCIFDANKLGRIEDGWLLLENVNVSVAPKAAERNPAEPIAVIRFDKSTPGNENEMPKVISCNWQPDGECEVYLRPAIAEAEARGRREALEAATARLEWYRQYGAGMIDQRGFAASLIAELKRMMTGGK